MNIKTKLLLALVLLCCSSLASAATCTIQGANLVAAYSIAKQNGHYAKCGSTTGSPFSYVSPGGIGCKGRVTPFNHGEELSLSIWRTRISNGWSMNNVRITGGPNKIKKAEGTGVLIKMQLPGLARKYDFSMTRFSLKHATKSCSNIQAVLKDAFIRRHAVTYRPERRSNPTRVVPVGRPLARPK